MAAGFAGSLGLLGVGSGGSQPTLDVSVWASEDAAEYPDLHGRVLDLLEPAFAEAGVEADVTSGHRPIDLDEEGGPGLLAETWPRLVLSGALRQGPVQPVGDVNLLVTDGDPHAEPPGYGMRGIAAVTGARYLASLPESIRATGVTDYTVRGAVAQLLLHEVGHALGLKHTHGAVSVDGDAVIASPMVSAYAWADENVRRRQLGRDANLCGESFPSVERDRRKLGLRYADCARRSIGDRGAGFAR